MDLSATKDCHCFAACSHARGITRFYEEKLRPHGLRATQVSVLAALSLTGPTLLGELADLLGVERATLTRNSNRLAEDGWGGDAESEEASERRLRLTAAGHQALKGAYPAWNEAQDKMDDRWSTW